MIVRPYRIGLLATAPLMATTLLATPLAAHAQLTYSPDSVGSPVRIGYRTIAGTTTPPSLLWAEGLESVFQPQRQEFEYTGSYDPAILPQVITFEQDYSVATQGAPERFELSWSGRSVLLASQPLVVPDRVLHALAVNSRLFVNVTSPTRLRLSWSGSGTGLSDPTNALRIEFTSLNGTIPAFVAGFGNPDASVTDPFSFEIDVPAGEQFDINFRQAFLMRSYSSPGNESGWSASQDSSFVIEVVPPSCVADFNNSGEASVQDIFDFLAAYFANDPASDVNDSGVISVQDIFDFLAAYFEGC